MDFNGALYSYVHNLQGDIVGIVDSAGSLVVEYKYDAWGKPTLARTLTTAYEALVELNPFRYRGYVWDAETDMYCLCGRYYALKWNRFISVDLLLSGFDSIVGKNPFVYCFNAPIMLMDEGGMWPTWAKVLVAAVAVAAVAAVCAVAAGALAAAALGTSASLSTGAAIVTGVKTATYVGGVTAGGIKLIEEANESDEFDFAGIMIETLSGVGYGLANGLSVGTGNLAKPIVGAITKSLVGAARALATSIKEGDSLGGTVGRLLMGAGVPLIAYNGKLYGLRLLKRTGLPEKWQFLQIIIREKPFSPSTPATVTLIFKGVFPTMGMGGSLVLEGILTRL